MGRKSLNLKEKQNRQGMGSSLFVRKADRELNSFKNGRKKFMEC